LHLDDSGEQTDWSKAREEGKMNQMTGSGVFLLAMLFLMTHLFAVEGRAEKRIGLLLWNDEARYIECKGGILEQLKKDGFGKAEVKFAFETAGGSKMKAGEIVQKFATAKMDLIIAVSTSAAIAVTKMVKGVPIVFSTVYDPIETGIAKE
jgi:putative ABC transport system substrate-binding protein